MSRFDFSGFDQFIRVATSLKAGREPERADWKLLFECPGYQALTRSEFPRESLAQIWRDALGQAGYDGCASDGRRRLMAHARRALTCRQQLLQTREQLELAEAGLLASARRDARQYLPAGNYTDWSDVSFLVFDHDARGYIPVVVDILLATDLGAGCRLAALLAHEFHHQQLARLKGLSLGGPDTRSDIGWVLDQLHMEGVAEMITVNQLDDVELARFMAQVRQAPSYLKRLDAGLTQIGQDATTAAVVGRELRQSLPQSGHPAGYYMAARTATQLGRRELIATAVDSAQFLAAFRRACLAGGEESPLSQAAVSAASDLLSQRPG